MELPDWIRFLIKIGTFAGKYDQAGKRLMLGVALPARDYAAAFVALGINYSRASLPARRAEDNYFQRLCALPVKTSVTCYADNKLYNGLLDGVEELGGTQHIRVKVSGKRGGDLTYLFNEARAHLVKIDGPQVNALPDIAKGKKVVRRPAFLDSVFDGVNIADYTLASSLEALVVGPVNLLRDEITHTGLAAHHTSRAKLKGALQDLLRVRKFLGPGKPFRSDVITDNSFEFELQTAGNPVVIFDGAKAYLKMSSYLRGFSSIVLLDRSKMHFRDAAASFNQEYVQRRLDGEIHDQLSADLPALPPIEFMAFEERAV